MPTHNAPPPGPKDESEAPPAAGNEAEASSPSASTDTAVLASEGDPAADLVESAGGSSEEEQHGGEPGPRDGARHPAGVPAGIEVSSGSPRKRRPGAGHYGSSWAQSVWQVLAITSLFMMVAITLVGQFRGDPDAEPQAWGEDEGDHLPRVEVLVRSEDDVANIEDPVLLDQAGRHWLSHDAPDLARACFLASLRRNELARYIELEETAFEAALLGERMGELEGSRAAWRAAFHDDVLSAYFFIHRLSVDPEKAALLEAARATIDDLVQRAKAGESPHFYTTSKGESRPLTVMTGEEALAAFAAGQKLRYVYIESLDLSGQTFTGQVNCLRCVVGELTAYGATFEDELQFRGIVLGPAHFGKKWKGEVNKSAIIPPARFNRIYLDNSVFLGGLNLESVEVSGRVANFPLIVVEGAGDLRNLAVTGTAEFRFAVFTGEVNLKGARFQGPSYFGDLMAGGLKLSRVTATDQPLFFNSAVFSGPVLLERCELLRGATFENASFSSDFVMRQCRIYDRMNFSRIQVLGDFAISHVEGTDLDFLGGRVDGDTDITDSVFTGNVRFALDGLTRRQHLNDANPLAKLYKQYQGDVDAEEDLTTQNQYGVTHVDDLTSVLRGNVSFANSIFEKFVSFEGVTFGTPQRGGLASFYNVQLYGEAHFERTRFYGVADFRTISGNEVSFNQAQFFGPWMLDDATVPGRLSASGARFAEDADISLYGSHISAFDLTMRQLKRADGAYRLFYEQCALAGRRGYERFAADPRLDAVSWDDVREVAVTDEAELAERTEAICYEHTVSEYVTLKESFAERSMSKETDWAYWNIRHYENRWAFVEASSLGEKIPVALDWLIFEKAFGWGVRLSNLLWTGTAVILIFMALMWWLCGDVVVFWDNEDLRLRELPLHALAVVSIHCFLGTDRDWHARTSNRTFKFLYVLELVAGIILVTFFIGAYTRMVLS